MSSDITFRIANLTVTLSLNGTDQQVGDTIRRCCLALGISVEGTNRDVLTRFLEHVRDDTRRTAKQYQLNEANKVSAATNAAQAESDNAL